MAAHGSTSEERESRHGAPEAAAQDFCGIPFRTVGIAILPVANWPAPIPPRWQVAINAYQNAFADAVRQALFVCIPQRDCPNIKLLNNPPLRRGFGRIRVVLPPFPALNFLVCIVVAHWVCVPQALPPPVPPPLPDDLPDIPEGPPIPLSE
jgi:hypothetical protein